MKLEFIKDLTTTQINLLVAKLEGIRVEIHKGHVARRLPFEPDASANDHDIRGDWMWLHYEPTEDWGLAGEIMQREGICMMFPAASSGEEKYSWTYYPDDNGDDVLCEHSATTGSESGMRTYVEKYFGAQVEIDNLPKIERIALVQVQSWSKPFSEITENDPDVFVEKNLEITAEHREDALEVASQGFADDMLISMRFIGWKSPVMPLPTEEGQTMFNKIVTTFSSLLTSNKGKEGAEVCNIVVPPEMRSVLPSIMSDREGFIYLLRMFWQKRFDKMSPGYLPVMDWLSQTFLPADLVAAKYHFPSHDDPRCLENEDHYALAKAISDAAFKCPDISELLTNN